MFYNSPKHKHNFCAIYRGPGGAGDATADAASEASLIKDLAVEVQADADAAEAAKVAAQAAQAAAETAETNAETAETNAETAETNAETAQAAAASSASAAATSATNAANSATAAQTAETNAETAETNAETAETNAADSASAASTSATNASNSASAAATSATNASNSASAAATSATNASNSATAAATSATNAANSATAAQTAETNAETAEANAETAQAAAELAETNAETAATNASSSASAASTSASNAATSATNASNSASAAATSATNASNSASAAATSATNASNSASAASGFADDASDFADAAAASAASIDVSGFMQKSANLSDLTDTTTARTNLGVAIGTNVQAWDADLDTWATKTAPTGTVVGTSDTQTLTNKTIDATQLVNASVTPEKLSTQSQYTGFKNRLINSAMMIDQRNAGASISNTGVKIYSLDRWFIQGSSATKFTAQQNAGSVTPPTGFTNYLGITSSAATSVGFSDYYFTGQSIEGFNTADLGWGTANAASVTLSFWVRSSLTGTFGGSLRNSAGNRSYPFSYTISAANTWEQKSITIAGDTTGTWVGATNGIGIDLSFNLGAGSTFSGTAGAWAAGNFISTTGATSVVGTNGATFYITGVQLEKGSTATSFDYRPYGTELALCQRYYYRWTNDTGSVRPLANLQAWTTTAVYGKLLDLPVIMRATPTCNATYTSFYPSSANSSGQPAFTGGDVTASTKQNLGAGNWSGSSGLVAGNSSVIYAQNGAYVEASAEL